MPQKYGKSKRPGEKKIPLNHKIYGFFVFFFFIKQLFHSRLLDKK